MAVREKKVAVDDAVKLDAALPVGENLALPVCDSVALLEAEAVAADVGVGMKPIALDCVAVAKRDRCVTVGVAAPELVPLPVPMPVVERLVCGDRLSVRAADLEPEPDDVAVRLRADLLPVPEDVGVGT